MTAQDLDELRSCIVQQLSAYLAVEPPPMDFSGGKYLCLKFKREAFRVGETPNRFFDSMEPYVRHVHVEHDDSAQVDLDLLLKHAVPDLQHALQLILFRLKLEGAL